MAMKMKSSKKGNVTRLSGDNVRKLNPFNLPPCQDQKNLSYLSDSSHAKRLVDSVADGLIHPYTVTNVIKTDVGPPINSEDYEQTPKAATSRREPGLPKKLASAGESKPDLGKSDDSARLQQWLKCFAYPLKERSKATMLQPGAVNTWEERYEAARSEAVRKKSKSDKDFFNTLRFYVPEDKRKDLQKAIKGKTGDLRKMLIQAHSVERPKSERRARLRYRNKLSNVLSCHWRYTYQSITGTPGQLNISVTDAGSRPIPRCYDEVNSIHHLMPREYRHGSAVPAYVKNLLAHAEEERAVRLLRQYDPEETKALRAAYHKQVDDFIQRYLDSPERPCHFTLCKQDKEYLRYFANRYNAYYKSSTPNMDGFVPLDVGIKVMHPRSTILGAVHFQELERDDEWYRYHNSLFNSFFHGAMPTILEMLPTTMDVCVKVAAETRQWREWLPQAKAIREKLLFHKDQERLLAWHRSKDPANGNIDCVPVPGTSYQYEHGMRSYTRDADLISEMQYYAPPERFQSFNNPDRREQMWTKFLSIYQERGTENIYSEAAKLYGYKGNLQPPPDRIAGSTTVSPKPEYAPTPDLNGFGPFIPEAEPTCTPGPVVEKSSRTTGNSTEQVKIPVLSARRAWWNLLDIGGFNLRYAIQSQELADDSDVNITNVGYEISDTKPERLKTA